MATKTQRKAPPKKTQPKSRPKSGKLIVFILVLFGIIVLVELASYISGQAGASKQLLVQDVVDINGASQPCGPFKAWADLVLPDGRIAVSDPSNKRILLFDAKGSFLQEIGAKQAGPPPMGEVSSLACDPSGNLYDIEPWNGIIRGFDPKGQMLTKISLDGKGFYGPRGLAWDNGGFIVADTGSHRLVKLSVSGDVQWASGHNGSGKEGFNNPVQVVLDGQGNYYVADQQNNRIQVLDSQGRFVREINLGAQPTAEAFDPGKKWLYVSSTDGGFVRAYTVEGKLVGTLVEGDKKNPIQNVNGLSLLADGDLLALKTELLTVYRFVPMPAGQP